MGARNTRSSVVEMLDLQSLGSKTVIYGEIDDIQMRYFNPSIAWEKDKLKIAIRSCNFAVERSGGWSFRHNVYSVTDVLYGDLDPASLNVSKLTYLKLSDNSPAIVHTAGLEDVRLFYRKDGMHASGFQSDRITRTKHNASATMGVYLIKDNTLHYLETLSKPRMEVVEKNWIPTDKPSNEFDYTYSPTQSYKGGIVSGEPYIGIIHGGTQLITQKDGTYLSIVHDKVLDGNLRNHRREVYDKWMYRHYLAKHDNKGIITQLSKPFRFGTHENIEFAAGMVEYKDDFIISLGIMDCKYAIVKIKKNKLLDLLKM